MHKQRREDDVYNNIILLCCYYRHVSTVIGWTICELGRDYRLIRQRPTRPLGWQICSDSLGFITNCLHIARPDETRRGSRRRVMGITDITPKVSPIVYWSLQFSWKCVHSLLLTYWPTIYIRCSFCRANFKTKMLDKHAFEKQNDLESLIRLLSQENSNETGGWLIRTSGQWRCLKARLRWSKENGGPTPTSHGQWPTN